MKILKFSGIVAGIHLLALILIFANPGCSSSTKPAPSPSDTESKSEPAPTISVPGSSSTAGNDTGGSASSSSAPIAFNPSTATPRYSPTRPGTPVASTLQAEPVTNVTPASTYTVVSGDSLSLIAKKNHIAPAELAAANNLNLTTAKIRPGQKLIIPSKSAPAMKASETSAALAAANSPAPKSVDTASGKTPPEGLKYTVKPGESLGVIAKRYGVKPGDIAVANNITDPQKIQAGMVLTIPGWQAPGGKKGSSSEAAKHSSEPKPVSPPVDNTEATKPAPLPEVPVIRVEDSPAPTKP